MSSAIVRRSIRFASAQVCSLMGMSPTKFPNGLIGCLAVLLLLCGAQSASAGTVALFATREAGQVVVDLAGVELSQREGVDLLDRSRIEQVLAEQKLTAFGDKSDPLLLGQLLGVEMFIVWDQPGAQPEGRLIVFDGASGIRLDDRHIAEKDVALIAQAVAKNVDAVQKKQQQIRDAQLRLISLTSIRNVNLPPQMQARAEQFLSQLEQSITQHPHCGMLERARLRYVVREQSLPIARKQAHLLGAAHTVTVELSQSGANQWVVKLMVHPAGQAQPLAIEETMKLDGGSGDGAVTASLAEKLSQLKVEDIRRFSEEERRQFEIAALMNEGRRMLGSGQGLKAASRYEAAYALGEVDYSLPMLSQSLRQYAETLSQNHWEHPAIPVHDVIMNPVSPECWFELADLAHYRIDVLDRMHQKSMREFNWPHLKSPVPGSDRFATGIDELRLLIPPNTVVLVTPDELPAQYNALQMAYLRGYDQHFQKFATDGRRKLQGDDLHRFNQQVSFNQLIHLADSIAMHFNPHWADQFVEVLTVNLQNERWLRDATTIAYFVNELPSQQRNLAQSRLDSIDFQKYPAGSLGGQYIRLYSEQGGSKRPSPEFDSHCVRLAEQIAEEYEKPDTNVNGIVGFGMPGIPILKIPTRQHALGTLQSATLQLVTNQELAQSTREALFLRLLQQEIFPSQLLFAVTSPRSGAASVETLKQAIEILEAKDIGQQSPWKELIELLRKSQKVAQAPMPNVTIDARHLSLPWRSVSEVSLSETGRHPTAIHFTGIHKGNLYIVSSREERGRNVIVLQIHRKSLTANTPSERIVEEDFSRDAINAGTLKVAQLRQCKVHLAGFFTLHLSSAELGFSDDSLVMPTVADGLYVFPIEGGPRLRVGIEKGLPSNFVQCAMPVGDKVLAWVGLTGSESNFVSIDRTSRKVQLLASCQREQEQTPLDNMPGAKFTLMQPPPNSKHLVMSIIDARGKISQRDSKNGFWEYNIAEGTFSQIPCLKEGDAQFFASGHNPFAINRYDSQTRQTEWVRIDPVTRKAANIPSVDIPLSWTPICCSDSVNWWYRKLSGVGHRQDIDSGEMTEFRVAVEGEANVDKVMFHQNENTAIIQMGTRLWIARDFHLKPE